MKSTGRQKKSISGIQNTDEYVPKLRENSVNQNPHRTNKNVRIFLKRRSKK